MTYLILPLIPPILIGVAGISALVATILLIKKFSNSEDGTFNIMLLGPILSGKTLFCNALQGIFTKEVDETTAAYTKHIIYISEKKDNKINVYDNSGEEFFIQQILPEIHKYKQIIFFCDINKYLNDKRYERNVNARLDSIYKHIDKSHQRGCIIFSHADLCENRNNSLENARSRLKECGKEYYAFFMHMITVNLTDKSETIKAIKNTLDYFTQE